MQRKPVSREMLEKIQNDLDFIVSTKYNNSIADYLSKHPNGADNNTIAKFLGLDSPDEAEEIYGISIESLKKKMNV